MKMKRLPRWLPEVVVLSVGLLLLFGRAVSAQQDEPPLSQAEASPIHPAFPLLDTSGANVLETNQPVSTMTTCGACHNTAFIAGHSYHADVGLSDYGERGTVPGGRAWDTGTGLFGKWSPLLYRYLSPQGDERIDLTTPEWVQLFGARHAGGGPAAASRDGVPLTDLSPDAGNVETSLVDPATAKATAWDWSESGIVEMNCFLCHLPDANNEARIEALAAGDFAAANTATLIGTGIVNAGENAWAYNPDAFEEDGNLKPAYITLGDPDTANCGSCHGVTHTTMDEPLVVDDLAPGDWNTLTTGQIMSPQRISESGLNLADKAAQNRAWDVHMERVVGCTDCHYAINNPVYYQEGSSQPDHLTFDPRRSDFSEYLYQPLHQFAKGNSAQGALAPESDNTLRRCESCHSIEATHDWLPYKERHAAAMSCETCHVPELFAPSLEYIDWTVLRESGEPVRGFRGVEGDAIGPSTLIESYQPAVLPRENGDGTSSLSPFNLVSFWYWVYDEPARPVPLRDLQAAYLEGDSYRPEVVAAFDQDGDGQLTTAELVITTDRQESLVAGILTGMGLANPRIEGEVQPFGISHNVAAADWATRECADCHAAESRLTTAVSLADRTPGGVIPALPESSVVSWPGSVEAVEGSLLFAPDAGEAGLYILGHSAYDIVDWLGILMLLGVAAGITIHAGARFWAARRRAAAGEAHEPGTQRVYMYDFYERLWHWLQTAVILLLLFTGLIIHKPDKFGIFSFSFVVDLHNILAAILVINAALALFYHLASGEIKQFLPQPKGFFDQAFEQAIYYVRGIFRSEPHPFEKSKDRKLNPLQQLTYLMILNVLLPLQILTGILMWGYQRWPDAAATFGGLPGLAPFHTLISWTFAAFIVLHVYLTTTGPTPLAGMEAMVMGWEDVEVHDAAAASEAVAAD